MNGGNVSKKYFYKCPIEAVEISLGKGLKAIIDKEDYQSVSQYAWFAQPVGKKWYARTKTKKLRNRKFISMHRFILKAPSGSEIDHINGDSLDNRKSNLRYCTRAQNAANRRPNQGKVHKGIRKTPNGKWRLAFTKTYDTKAEALEAHNRILKDFYGDYAYQQEVTND